MKDLEETVGGSLTRFINYTHLLNETDIFFSFLAVVLITKEGLQREERSIYSFFFKVVAPGSPLLSQVCPIAGYYEMA